jgi:ArsR family transcriptional regulator
MTPQSSTVVYVYGDGERMPTAPPDQLISDLVACCSPITGHEVDWATAERLAVVLKALAEPTRLRLVSLIAAHDHAEACVADLTDPIGLTQPTVSHHLKVLVDAGLLEREQRSKWAYYRIVPGALDALAGILSRTNHNGSSPQHATTP